MEVLDEGNSGKINANALLEVLQSLKIQVPLPELERYIRLIDKDSKGRLDYQKLMGIYENTKHNYPLKAVGLRLLVFLKQNGLNSKTLLEKLLNTKL